MPLPFVIPPPFGYNSTIPHFAEVLMSQTLCQFHVDSEDRAHAFAVIESYGMSPSEVFRLFLKQISQTKEIPLALDNITKESPNPHSDIVDFVKTLPPAGYSETGLTIQKRMRDEWV